MAGGLPVEPRTSRSWRFPLWSVAGLAAGVAVASALRAVPAGPVIETLTVMGSLWMNALRMYLTAGCALAAVVTGVLSLATIVTRWSAPCGSEAVMGAAGSHAS